MRLSCVIKKLTKAAKALATATIVVSAAVELLTNIYDRLHLNNHPVPTVVTYA
jgi:hypothetical protein